MLKQTERGRTLLLTVGFLFTVFPRPINSVLGMWKMCEKPRGNVSLYLRCKSTGLCVSLRCLDMPNE